MHITKTKTTITAVAAAAAAATTCMLIDVAISGDRKVTKMEAEKF